MRRNHAITVVSGNKVIGWRMTDGSVACIKRRYTTAVEAETHMAIIRSCANQSHIPIRSYRCNWCGGFHLTSRA